MRSKLQPLELCNVPIKFASREGAGVGVGIEYQNIGGTKLMLMMESVLKY